MRSPLGRIALALGTVAVVVALFLVLRGPDDGNTVTPTTRTAAPTTTAPTTTARPQAVRRVRIAIRDGRISGPRAVTVRKGERLVLVVRADVSDHVHVHGYDRFADVGPGRPAQIALRATIAGRFEVELEDRKLRILELEVRP